MNTLKKTGKKMGKNFITLSVAFMVLALVVMVSLSAYQKVCLTDGQKLTRPNGHDYTCRYDICTLCIDAQNYSTDLSRCEGGACGTVEGGEGPGVDGVPPVLTINSPTNSQLFNSRKALIDFSVNEGADVYYTDAVNGRGRWSKLCSNCVTYSRNLSFDEGQNIIRFKAIDNSGNTALSNNVSFFTDSKKPKIKKTLPKNKDFGNGDFNIYFQEANPSTLTLFYGNNGSSSMNVPISSCIKDNRNNKKYSCTVHADLGPYNGQLINYWFMLTDIVGNVVISKPVNINVDLTAPVINNPGSFFSNVNNSKYVYFNISITEDHFDEAVYSYIDSRNKTKEGRLCSSLKNGVCNKKLTFTKGAYALTISVNDKAGNSLGLPANFVIDY